jgi:hypothetical protein
VTVSEHLIQPLQMFDVRGEVVQKHDIKKHSQHLRERRVILISSLFLMFQVFTTSTDGENPICSQPYDRAQRLLQAHTPIAEKRSSACGSKPYWLKYQRNGRRRADVLDRDLCRQSHPPAPVPHGVAFGALNEQIAFPGVVIRGGNGERVQMSAPDVVLDPVTIEMGM